MSAPPRSRRGRACPRGVCGRTRVRCDRAPRRRADLRAGCPACAGSLRAGACARCMCRRRVGARADAWSGEWKMEIRPFVVVARTHTLTLGSVFSLSGPRPSAISTASPSPSARRHGRRRRLHTRIVPRHCRNHTSPPYHPSSNPPSLRLGRAPPAPVRGPRLARTVVTYPSPDA